MKNSTTIKAPHAANRPIKEAFGEPDSVTVMNGQPKISKNKKTSNTWKLGSCNKRLILSIGLTPSDFETASLAFSR